jgi:hypothetical protein
VVKTARAFCSRAKTKRRISYAKISALRCTHAAAMDGSLKIVALPHLTDFTGKSKSISTEKREKEIHIIIPIEQKRKAIDPMISPRDDDQDHAVASMQA